MRGLGLLFVLLVFIQSYGQVVNAYAKVTSITGETLSLSNVNQVNHTFVVGEFVIIIQVQDDVIGANTSNTATFGNLSSIESAGLYEVREIIAINGNGTAGFSSATPTSIELDPLGNTYNTGTHESVQIVSFRQFGLGNYTTTSDMSALDWDGNVGGVLAVYVPGILTLNHSLSADQNGFRGGAVSSNYSGPTCNVANSGRYRENSTRLGFKGEGIYLSTDPLHNNGRGKMLNGGGGGSHHNGGGGGGGNYTSGGQGGNGWNNCTTHPAGGIGGLSLSGEISGDRVFFGGGGGGGQQNNSQSRDGGDGGGIIFVRANEITSGACAGVSISANGTGPLTSGTNDGGGGGGAGGSVVFWVDTWSITGGCPLTISANGGDGSSSLSGGSHAGGAGGAQGVIIFNDAEPTTNVSTETANGDPGCGNTSSPCNSLAGAPSGTDDDGIFVNTLNPLPIELISFTANRLNESAALISWTTKSEVNNDYFTLYKSEDANDWYEIKKMKGAGNSSEEINYQYTDRSFQQGINYYKLQQTDFDGTSSFHQIIALNNEYGAEVLVYPNPTEGQIEIISAKGITELELLDPTGRSIFIQNGFGKMNLAIDLTELSAGTYFLQIKMGTHVSYHQLVKK